MPSLSVITTTLWAPGGKRDASTGHGRGGLLSVEYQCAHLKITTDHALNGETYVTATEPFVARLSAYNRITAPHARVRFIDLHRHLCACESMKMRWIKRSVSALLLASLVWMIATREGLTNLGPRLLELDGPFLALALTLPWVAIGAGVLRWKTLLRIEGIEVSFPWLLRSFLRGRFVGAFTPSTTGLDLYRLVDVAEEHSKAASGRVILVEKLYGLVALAMVTLMLLPFGVARFFGSAGLLMAAGLGGVSVIGLFGLERPELLKRLPFAKAQKLADALGASRPSFRRRAELMSLGVVSHMATALVFVATGLALGVRASPFELAIVGNAIVLATLLPLSVGGFGVREATAVALLSTVGVSTSDALLVGLLGYLVAQPPALIGGALLAAKRTHAHPPDPIGALESTPSATVVDGAHGIASSLPRSCRSYIQRPNT